MKKNLILSVLMFMSFPLVAMSWSDNDGIFDFIPSRDLYAVKSMIEDNQSEPDLFVNDLRFFDSMTNKILTQSYVYDVLFYNLQSDQCIHKVLRKDGKTIGFMIYYLNECALFELDCLTWNLEALVIDEEYRSHGYGSAMLQYLIKDVQACGGDQIITLYDDSNLVTQEFYKKNGFNTGDMPAVRIIDNGDLSGFNEAKILKVFKALAKNCFYAQQLNNFKGISINPYDLLSRILNESIDNIDNLTIEEFDNLDFSCRGLYLKSLDFDFDNYKIKTKMKLQKIKAILELNGPECEAWCDYITFKIIKAIYANF